MIDLTSKYGQQVLKAIARKSADPDFRTIVKWIQDSLDVYKDELIFTEGEKTIRAQGYAEALKDIVTPCLNPQAIIHGLNKALERAEVGKKIREV